MTLKYLELLAPAKNLECGKAAIDCGADAVYIGGPAYGARINAPNTLEEIEELCKYAHLFKAKVHVALNTILNNQELEEARALAFTLYDKGVDALIIQDVGLLEGPLPPLEIHASTQQDNTTPEKVLFLEKLGFKQAVLARELSINDIKKIREKAKNIKLEAFIHGALCVGISGRCYLSACVTGRSANRGECSQLCRVKASLLDENKNEIIKDKYLLSLKDFNQSNNLKELIEAGVSSFKIEGRLKDEMYVRNVVAHYRKLIDSIIAEDSTNTLRRSSYGKSYLGFTPDVNKTFNRGYTEYNFHEVKDNYANFDAPGFVGSKIGKLIAQQGNTIKLKLDKNITLNNGDSLNYYDHNDELQGFRISTVDGDIVEIFQKIEKIKIGTTFYRNKDAKFEASLKLNQKTAYRKVKLSLIYEETDNYGEIKLYGTDETNTSAIATITLPEPSIAQNLEKLNTNINDKISRLGDSVYELDNLTIKIKHNLFVPVSMLNQLRRDLIDKLNELKNTRDEEKLKENIINNSEEIILPLSEINLGFKANIFNDQAKAFYLKHGATNIIDAYEKDKGNTPRELLVSKHCLRYCINQCPIRHKVKPRDLYIKIGNKTFKLDFDCKNCYMKIVG